MSKKIIFDPKTGEIISSGSPRPKQEYTVPKYSEKAGTVSIHGETYRTVQIGKQLWMAENLKSNQHHKGNSCCYDRNPANCQKYGRLYDWEAAVDIASRIPGWHLATDEEWMTLEMAVGMSPSEVRRDGYRGGDDEIGIKLKEGGSSGFNALLAGSRYSDGSFDLLGGYGYFWSASPSGGSNAFSRSVDRSDAGVGRYSHGRTDRDSVRLVKD